MTKLDKKNTIKNMYLHDKVTAFEKFYNLSTVEASKAAELLDVNLGYGYTKTIIDRAKSKGHSLLSYRIRNVKHGAIKDLLIFEMLLKLAKENKDAVQSIQNLTR